MTSEENEELVAYRFNKAKETLQDAIDLVAANKWNLAVNRVYYSCFYAVNALLAKRQIYTKTHSGAKQMFGMHFVKTGEIDTSLNDFYVKVFSMRQSGDYEDFCDYEEEEVAVLIAPASLLLQTIERKLQ